MSNTKKRLALKLYRYKWRGEDKSATILSGKLDAVSEDDVRKRLESQGLKKISVKRSLDFRLLQTSKITTRDINIFTKQLAILVRSDISIVKALDLIILSQEKLSFRQILLQIREDLISGVGLAESFSNYPHIFNNFYCGILDAGSRSGKLSEMLKELLDFQEKLAIINSKVKKALIYPFFVLLFGFGVSAFLLVKVIPQFEAMFNNFGSQLPWITAKVLQFSNFIQNNYLYLLLFFLALLGFFYYWYKKSISFKYGLALTLLKIPLISKMFKTILTARLSRLLALCFSADIRIVEALDISSSAIANPVFSRKLSSVAQKVNLGQKLSFAMQDEKIFPNLMLQLISIGEETSNLTSLLDQAADFYDLESNDQLDKLTSLLEPLVIIILGGIIGILVISIYLPIFTLNSAIGG